MSLQSKSTTASFRILASSAVLFLTACGSGFNTVNSTTPLVAGAIAPGGATTLYLAQVTSTGSAPITCDMLQFPANGSGVTMPSATLNTPANFYCDTFTTDSSGNIYLAGYTSSFAWEVLVYPANSSGSAAPARTILLPDPYAGFATSLAVDSAGQLYVSAYSGALSVYSPTANGSATPLRTIYGSATQLGQGTVSSIAADASGNIYAALYSASPSSPSSILVFSSSANGNVAPSRAVNFTTSSLNVISLSTDSSGNLYAATTVPNGSSGVNSIVKFAPGASGAATPTLTLSGSSTALGLSAGLTVDRAGNIYSLNLFSHGTYNSYTITGYGPTATGNMAPAVQWSSAASMTSSLPGPGVGLD